MTRFDGALALKLDFGERATVVTGTGRGAAGLRLAPRSVRLAGPDKYRVLEHRRRRAQMAARRLLDVMEMEQVR